MAELESSMEKNLIKQLCTGESQWTYRPDLRTEDDLWNNFRYILEQNNKAKLGDTPLTDAEFAKIKNDMSHPTFYNAAEWLIGENGKVYVHVQRGSETLHLLVLNNEHIAGGTSVYEVINQYQASKGEDEPGERNRRFDVTLMINGIPLIHIELKNKSHSYVEGFNQIKKYISEGKFRGLFSNIQMFVVSNGVDTKYFAAARDTDLNKKFMSGWLDFNNNPVCDLSAFADEVLHIPQAHEMVTKYTVLDSDKKSILILRPYQIHAIEAMREASKRGESGFIWHTTGSGKTMTSYKATRNLLMDIPSIDKTIFLIDRKDLDTQTTMAFQSYAINDTIDVDDTDNVNGLKKRLTDGNRHMIVTTRQKMQILTSKRLKEGTKEYETVRNLRVAFVVDECHRAVTPQTKRDLGRFFTRSLWYGFTGTPIFNENKYETRGDLPQTTEQMYGKCLHSYTIKEAIHDNAVLGFNVEYLGYRISDPEQVKQIYSSENHMRKVLNIILNRSFAKFGMQKGRGKTYEALLTVSSIEMAQKYYDLLKKVVNGEDELKISDEVRQALPDFPKFAITYSLSENEEASHVNQEKMKASINDYNKMFGASDSIENIAAYNKHLNDRLARKKSKYLVRDQQLDLVIVVNRLLTGFDAPCLSTLFIDRQPMKPQNLIQAFSRTNRLFDGDKKYGQIVTFQSPEEFKAEVDSAIALYSRGGEGEPIAEDFDTVKQEFEIAVQAVRFFGSTAEDINKLSKKEKKNFVHRFRELDTAYAHLKSFSSFTPEVLEASGFSQEEYETYAAIYKNVLEELKSDDDDVDDPDDIPIDDDYDLVAYSKVTIDYEYIVGLLQDFVDDIGSGLVLDEEINERLDSIQRMVEEYTKDNPKLGALLMQILREMQQDNEQFRGKSISAILNEMCSKAIEDEIRKFSEKWFVPFDEAAYEAYRFRNGEILGENQLKESVDYSSYKEAAENPMPKFRFRKAMIKDFKEKLMPEIEPLIRR